MKKKLIKFFYYFRIDDVLWKDVDHKKKKRKEEIFKLALEKERRIIDIELGELIDRNVGLIGF